MKKIIIFLLPAIFSCTSDKTIKISLEKLQIYKFSDDRINVLLLKSYKNEDNCSENNKNANLYLCKEAVSGDTILVIDPCSKMPDFAKSNYKGENDLVINQKSILNSELTSIIINDKALELISSKRKYLIASLTKLIY